MRASTASAAKPCRRPRKASLTILIALFALAAGVQALVPAQAAAVMSEGSDSACKPSVEDPTHGTMTIGGVIYPCDIFNVTGSAPQVIPGLPQTYGNRIPTGEHLGGGFGSGLRGGSATKVPKGDKVKMAKIEPDLLNPKDGEWFRCALLRSAYRHDLPLSVGSVRISLSRELFYDDQVVYFGAHDRDFGYLFWSQVPPPDWSEILRLNARVQGLKHSHADRSAIDDAEGKLTDALEPLRIWSFEWDKRDKCAGDPPWEGAERR
jgi:hypothetical protein